MNRHTLRPLTRVIAVVAFSVVALSAATVTPVHPQAGGTNAPVQLAIVADHYTDGQEQEFNYDVQNFIKYGLLADPFYKTKGASMRIVSYFDATPAGQESRFDFEIGPGDGNCAVKAPQDVLTKLQAAVGTVLPTHFIVVANHPYNIGCTIANWSYVAVDAVGTDVLQHELGHLVGLLFDEWALPSNGTTPHPGLINETLNCASGTPYWVNNTNYPGAKALPACDLYENGVFHADEHCRMGAMNHRKFCDVCNAAMEKAFAFVNSVPPPIETPQPQASHAPAAAAGFRIMNASFATTAVMQDPSNPPRPIMRMVVDFDPGSPAPDVRAVQMAVRQRIFAVGVYVPNHRRVGEFLYEVSDRNGVREVGIIPASYFKSRALTGGGAHGTGPARPVRMFLDIPNEDVKSASDKTRNLKVVVYRIPRTVTDPIITKESWAVLRKAHPFVMLLETPLPPP
jgi:hypothetical protein